MLQPAVVEEYPEREAASSQIAVVCVPLVTSAHTLRRLYLGWDGLAFAPPPWRVSNGYAFLFFRGQVTSQIALGEEILVAPDPGFWDGPPEVLPNLPDHLLEDPPVHVPQAPELFDALRSDQELVELLAHRLGAKRHGERWEFCLLKRPIAIISGLKASDRTSHYLVYDFGPKRWLPLEAAAFAAAHGRLPNPSAPEERCEAKKLLLELAYESGILLRKTCEALDNAAAILHSLLSSIPPFHPVLGSPWNNLETRGVPRNNLETLPPLTENMFRDCSQNSPKKGMESLLWQVWEGLGMALLEGVRDGHPSAGASVRWLAGRLGLKPRDVCHCINFLAVLGLIKKAGKDVRPGVPGSQPERFVLCYPTYEAALARWASLGFPRPKQISRRWLEAFWPPEMVATVIRGGRGKRAEALKETAGKRESVEDEEWIQF